MSEHVKVADRPDTDWRALTLENSWTGALAAYRKFDGRVYLRGTLTPGTLTDGTTLFTLPADARPTNDATFPVVPDGGDAMTAAAARLKITASTGTAKIYFAAGAASLSINGVDFSDDQ